MQWGDEVKATVERKETAQKEVLEVNDEKEKGLKGVYIKSKRINEAYLNGNRKLLQMEVGEANGKKLRDCRRDV